MFQKALIIVDLQNDFCPGGALAVSDGDQIVPVVNKLIKQFAALDRPIYASRDWHPSNHVSFIRQGGPWPPHCVQNTPGAEFHPGLELPAKSVIVSKADDKDKDAYSAFDETEMEEQLKELGVDEIIVCGLATDYCVKATALEGISAGFKVSVVKDAVRGVEVTPGDSEKAFEEMQAAGVRLISSREVS